MLSKIIGIGNKIELSRVGVASTKEKNADGFSDNKVFVSQVYDIIDEDRLKIAMPLDGGKVVLMPNNTRIDAFFYTTKGLYQGRFVIVDRYKEGNLMVQVIELINELKKFQRRQYFRLSCTMEIMYRCLSKEEYDYYFSLKDLSSKISEESLSQAVALDLSGGGMRLVSKERLEKNDIAFFVLSFNYEVDIKKYAVLGKVIGVNTSKNNHNLFEHRIEFSNVNGTVREDIIKFIFEEERKRRKKENGQ
jgi:c-di-GMP-binding flagellar brake protein YcgR